MIGVGVGGVLGGVGYALTAEKPTWEGFSASVGIGAAAGGLAGLTFGASLAVTGTGFSGFAIASTAAGTVGGATAGGLHAGVQTGFTDARTVAQGAGYGAAIGATAGLTFGLTAGAIAPLLPFGGVAGGAVSFGAGGIASDVAAQHLAIALGVQPGGYDWRQTALAGAFSAAGGAIAGRYDPSLGGIRQAVVAKNGMTIAERQAKVAARTPAEVAARLTRANDLRRMRDGIPSRLYHYTDKSGEAGILASKQLHPSLKAINPKDARYGDGQYLSDIAPGARTPAQLSYDFLRMPFQGRRFTHFVEIDVSGLRVIRGRDGVFVIPNSGSLNLSGRIVSSGSH